MTATQTFRVDGAVYSLAIKSPCVAVSSANLTLTGEQTVNSIAVVEEDRVLVKDQTDTTENGIYVVETGAWDRAKDFDGNRDIVDGTLVTVAKTTGMNFFYQVDATDPIVIGTSAIAFLLASDPNVSWQITQTEIDYGLTTSDINDSYKPGHILRYGTNTTPGTTGMKAAAQIMFDLDHPGYAPAGTYAIESKLTWNGGAVSISGDGGFASEFRYTGSAGTFIEIGKDQRHESSINGIYLNANSLATKILHVGVSATTVAVVRQMALNGCILANADGASSHAIWLGDYTAQPGIAEADIAQFLIDKCEFLDNKNGITWDSTNAVGVILRDTFMSRVNGTTLKAHINMVRGGNVQIDGSYFGGASPDGTDFCFYVKDGWINVDDCDLEYSLSGGGGGVLHLDTPALDISLTGTPSSMSNNRVSNDGRTSTGNHILISSANHPLTLIGNHFYGRGNTSNYAIDNTNGSRVVSINNTYEGRPWNGTSAGFIQSIGDIYDDTSTLNPMPANIGRQRTIDSTNDPYTVAFDDETILSTSGACVINLPACGNPQTGGGPHRRLTIIRTSASGTTTVTPNGSDTINGLASVAIANGQYGGLTIESDGSAAWNIVAYYVQSNFSAASSGTGTVKMANAASSNSVGWLEVSPGKFVPYWTDVTP